MPYPHQERVLRYACSSRRERGRFSLLPLLRWFSCESAGNGRFSMLHMLHGVARVARRIGGFRGAGLVVLCSMCSIMQNRVPSKAGLAVLAYRMSIIVARGSQAVSVHLRHPMLLA